MEISNLHPPPPMPTVSSRKITLCACASRGPLSVAAMAARAAGAGWGVTLVDDLCGCVARGAPEAFAAASGGAVAACRPRAVRALFEGLGVPGPGILVDIRNEPLERAFSELGLADVAADAEVEAEYQARIAAMPRHEGTDAWFPVIDKGRCGECEKCHDFCLFGVYALEEGRVAVRQPRNCKNNCPACARLCPAGAIIFPKHPEAPIDGGEGEAVTTDPRAIYNEALRERLAARRAAGAILFKE